MTVPEDPKVEPPPEETEDAPAVTDLPVGGKATEEAVDQADVQAAMDAAFDLPLGAEEVKDTQVQADKVEDLPSTGVVN